MSGETFAAAYALKDKKNIKIFSQVTYSLNNLKSNLNRYDNTNILDANTTNNQQTQVENINEYVVSKYSVGLWYMTNT